MIVLFWICAAVALISGVSVIASRQPVHSVVGLIVNFAALAVLFLSLSADFLAMIQIIIYAGAILVLFLFVIALLTIGAQPIERGPGRLQFQTLPSVVAGLSALVVMGLSVRGAGWGPAAASVPADFGSVATFGGELLTTHLFAFEVTAFILLVAIIGVVLMAGRKEVRF
jgi:NADH-quinone oxidoreductase subunit J